MDPNEYVPVMIPAGKHVNIGCVGIRLNADLHAMAHYGTLCLSESVWRHVVLANPAHEPENWKTKRAAESVSSTSEVRDSNISSADSSDEMKNIPASCSAAQTSNSEEMTPAIRQSKLGAPSGKNVIMKSFISLENA